LTAFYTLAEGTQSELTKTGHHPLAFRTAAVGDRRLLGQWLYVEDLGGWVHASDTGRRCSAGKPGPCLSQDTIDIFIGDGHMQRAVLDGGGLRGATRLAEP